MSINDLKRAAARRAVEYLESGMVVGLGSGSTARYATLRVAERLREGGLRDILAVPTSEETAELARGLGIPLTSLEDQAQVDVTLDGADEVDPQRNVIKGLGGFLLREKIVAYATRRVVIIVDDSKLVDRLGQKAPVPVEVARFGWKRTWAALEDTGACVSLREARGRPYVTDEGHYILDCRYEAIPSPEKLAVSLNAIPGVVENGLFIGLVGVVVVASAAGVRILSDESMAQGR
ncbi:MAG: ribose-5-phosphate isomerase RpiA [Chloroflexi bacterium]|nr:ribose-5-phosphate isomerase RpiA [Chloroflexota bacterium]